MRPLELAGIDCERAAGLPWRKEWAVEARPQEWVQALRPWRAFSARRGAQRARWCWLELPRHCVLLVCLQVPLGEAGRVLGLLDRWAAEVHLMGNTGKHTLLEGILLGRLFSTSWLRSIARKAKGQQGLAARTGGKTRAGLQGRLRKRALAAGRSSFYLVPDRLAQAHLALPAGWASGASRQLAQGAPAPAGRRLPRRPPEPRQLSCCGSPLPADCSAEDVETLSRGRGKRPWTPWTG